MNRKEFIKIMSLMPFAGAAMNLNSLANLADSMSKSETMPVLFLGHGNPMNAIDENEFVAGFRNIVKEIPRPKAILCISAHWETKGTFVTAMEFPKTIHDFGGFPNELYDVQYPAPGNPIIAQEIKREIKSTEVGLDNSWGLDHGAWSVIIHLYPKADIPVLEMSIDQTKPASYHYELAKELQKLRNRSILIIGSGNMVHNLRKVAWDKMNTPNYAFDWASEASHKMKQFIISGNHKSLIEYQKQGTSFELSIPTPEHYLPMIYTFGLQGKNEGIKLFNDKAVGGSLTMTSFKIG